MSEFEIYLRLGVSHILDWNAYDHLLFIVALSTVHALRGWKKLFYLVTAFTVGHSITLGLATFNLLSVPSDIIEFLIPVTIMVTAFSNLFRKEKTFNEYGQGGSGVGFFYVLTIFFGLVHGLGFSNYLRTLMGKSGNIALELFSFNLGIELAQLVIVLAFVLISYVLVYLFGINRREWNVAVSSGVIALAGTLAYAAKFW